MKDEIFSLANLKYFSDAIRLGGLSAAAKANFVTQSAISQGISKLEKSLGVSLLAHHPNRLRLTSHGERVYNESLELLKRIAAFQQNLSQEEAMGDLAFVCAHSFALAVISPYLKRFREEHVHIKVNFCLGKNEEIVQKVKEGAVDFGILPLEICQKDQCQPYEADLSRFEKRPIYFGNFAFYVSSKIKKADQKKLGFILTPEDSKETIFLKDAFYKKHKQELISTLEVESWEVIADLVADGMGIGYLPDYMANRRKGLLQSCDYGIERLDYRITAIFPQGMKIRKSSEVFLSYFQKI